MTNPWCGKCGQYKPASEHHECHAPKRKPARIDPSVTRDFTSGRRLEGASEEDPSAVEVVATLGNGAAVKLTIFPTAAGEVGVRVRPVVGGLCQHGFATTLEEKGTSETLWIVPKDLP